MDDLAKKKDTIQVAYILIVDYVPRGTAFVKKADALIHALKIAHNEHIPMINIQIRKMEIF